MYAAIACALFDGRSRRTSEPQLCAGGLSAVDGLLLAVSRTTSAAAAALASLGMVCSAGSGVLRGSSAIARCDSAGDAGRQCGGDAFGAFGLCPACAAALV